MKSNYEKIIKYILDNGKILVQRSEGLKPKEREKFFKNADIEIERGLKEIIFSFGVDHVLFSEEENNIFKDSKNIWVADPISGTQSFLNGLPHYCLVVSHLVDNTVVFACIYDPSVDELFTAYYGKGTFLNNKQVFVSDKSKIVSLRGVMHFSDKKLVNKLLAIIPKTFNFQKSFYSYSYNYCSVACGRLDGIISLTKDSFPEFAGSLLIREAGGSFTNSKGDIVFSENDRIFIAGNKQTYEKLFSFIK